jgi:4-amino-4-deoxy-L-arabinose transferase-like glycosyltransferase
MTAPQSTAARRHWLWWFMLAVLVLVALARVRLLDFPLERDEGEYAYAGQLILQGIPPYELAYNMKFPGTYLAYAGIMAVFGQTPTGIHFGLLLLTTATALMIFWLGRAILDDIAGAIAAASYAVLAASTAMFGYSAHATHFCAFFVMAGLCLLWLARKNEKWWWLVGSGFFLGTAILMKQHAALIALWAGLCLAATCLRRQEIPVVRRCLALLAFSLAVILPFGLCCLWLWLAGVFGKFWFWTVAYAQQYVSIIHQQDALRQLSWSLHSIFSDCWLWWFAVAGLGLIWFDGRLQGRRAWLVGFSLAAALTTAPGFYFRTHYFLLALPAAALLAGCAVSSSIHCLRQNSRTTKFWPLPALAYGVILAMVLYHYSDVSSVLSRVGGHALYGPEPVPESEVVAAFIRSSSPPAARIAVLGSEPQIYFYARRHSATGYIYVYGLMEPQLFAGKMQSEMIGEIETNAPEYVVYSNIDSSWQRRPDSNPAIFNWWARYRENYDLVGIAEEASLLETHYFWNEDAATHGPLKNIGLEVYRRKASLRAPPSN